MKILLFLCCLLFVSGCGKVTEITSSGATETEQTGDPVYDSQTEMKLLLPWTWVI